MGIDLPLVWPVIIPFGVIMYVLLDGFDLGVGILYPFLPGDDDRDTMMTSVAPIWDGNETWLVLGGGGLFAAFPLAYSIVLPALLPAVHPYAARLDLPGRRVRVPLQGDAAPTALWDKAFIGGSIVATFFQGVSSARFIEGFAVVNRAMPAARWTG